MPRIPVLDTKNLQTIYFNLFVVEHAYASRRNSMEIFADSWCPVPECVASQIPCVGAPRHPFGSRPSEHFIDACSRSSGNCGGCRGFFATFRTYTPWPVHTLELDSATDLPPVRVRPQPN